MSKWSVLVIDDEVRVDGPPKGRHQSYLQLQGATYEHKTFDLTFASHADDARECLRSDTSTIVLLDVRLNRWGDDDFGTLFKELFQLANERCVVALVSSAWDDTSMSLVRDFLISRPEIRVPLFFTFRDFESGAFAAITTQLVTYLKRERSLHTLDLSANEPLRLLHISDLHFGSTDAAETLASVANTQLLCDRIKAMWPAVSGTRKAGPHLIAVTGDIANTGHPSEYQHALEWFGNFTQQFGWSLPTPRILLVPGNHDFSIPLCGAQLLQLNASRKLEISARTAHASKLTAYAMQPFSEFSLKVSSIPFSGSQAPLTCWIEFGFGEYGVVFSGFNTSKTANDDAWPYRQIDKEDIAHVKQKLSARSAWFHQKKIFHVSLAHHSPVSYPGVRDPISNEQEYLEHFMAETYAPKLLLHGHVHKRWGACPDNRYAVISAPTPTKNPAARSINSPLGVNLLTLRRRDSVVIGVEADSLIQLESGWQRMDLPNFKQFNCPLGV